MLIEADHEYEYTANAAGETPLYLAAENVYGSFSMVAHILEVWPSAAHDGPNGMTTLHAAAKCNNEAAVNILLAKKPALAGQADNDGWTALHSAADRLSYLLYNAFNPLLNYDTRLAVRQDKNGMTPLHVAVSHSKTYALDFLPELCPECQEVVDNDGRNYLHIAIMRGDKKMVKHISRRGYLTKIIINQPDNDGNTPLHIAAVYKKCGIIIYLMSKADAILNYMAINKENLTAFGIIDKVKVRDDDGVDKKYAGAWLMLLMASRTYRGRIKLAEESDTSPQTDKDTQKYNKKRKEKVTSQIQNVSDGHLVVATLIATVAFAAGFALSGGYKSDGKDEGMATLLRQTCFEAFAISNTTAMIFSSFAIVIHFVLKLIED